MANAFDVWDKLNDILIGDCDRDTIVLGLRKAGYTVDGGGAAIADDAPEHHVLIVGDAAGSECFFVSVLPDAELDDVLRAALRTCRNEHIDNCTVEREELWAAWSRVALATGARTREDLELGGDPVPLDDDEIAALTGRWEPHTFSTWNDRLDGAVLDRNIASVTMVFADQ
jgi:hypothetical protein